MRTWIAILTAALTAGIGADCFSTTAGELLSVANTPKDPVINCVLWLGQHHFEFNLANRADLNQLQQKVKLELDLPQDADDRGDEPQFGKRKRRGLREILLLAQALLDCTKAQDSRKLQTLLLETTTAVNNLRRPPIPEAVDFFETPFVFLNRISRPIAQGRTPASNLESGSQADLSRLDPEPSTFWRKPISISTRDLYHGFERTNLLLGSELCAYSGPKESFGRNPGFEVGCSGRRLKVKFAEISSEPFAARIFDALGFHVDPTDYARCVRIRYSRRIFLEFNSRKALNTHFTFLGFVPLFTLKLQQHYDPFDFISGAVLKDGTRWSGQELKRRLLLNPLLDHPETDSSNFLPEVESRIQYLETAPANVQCKIGKSIGPWDFGQLEHASRRELRGAGLLAAWLGWFDTRFDNTRLRIVQRNGKHDLEHYFSDLGGVLGETTGMLYARGELPNSFPWTFTRPPLWQGPQRLARPLRLFGYKPIAPTPAFAAMTIDDARWMARLIEQLSPEQIGQALIASGFDSAHVRLYLAKLLSRRERMVIDLGLANELFSGKITPVNRHFSYDPTSDGPLRVSISGSFIEAAVGTNRVANGKLLPLSQATGSMSKARANPSIRLSF